MHTDADHQAGSTLIHWLSPVRDTGPTFQAVGQRRNLMVPGTFGSEGRSRDLYSNASSNHAIGRRAAVLSDFRSPFWNGPRRSVNRKVQGSSPCPGANF